MQTASLPLELLINVIIFALSVDQKVYHVGGIGEILEWVKPNPPAHGLILLRESGLQNPISAMNRSVHKMDKRFGEIKGKSAIKGGEGLSKGTTCTYALTTSLRLYVIIFF
jgi:hypothetical protein